MRSILNDLVESGLVRRRGRGRDMRYRTATAEELEELGSSEALDSDETNAALVWVHLYPASPIPRDKLSRLVPLPPGAFDAALARLVEDGRARLEDRPDGTFCLTELP